MLLKAITHGIILGYNGPRGTLMARNLLLTVPTHIGMQGIWAEHRELCVIDCGVLFVERLSSL